MQSNNQTTETPKLRIVTIVTEAKSIDKEINLPYFFKTKSGYICKVVSNKHLIRVEIDKDWWSACVRPLTDSSKEDVAKGTQITEFEFDAAYQKAMMYVDLINRNEDPLREEDENVKIDQNLYGEAI